MTYHLERTLTFRNLENDKVNRSAEFDKDKKFPEKLWEIAGDSNSLITWTLDGTAVRVNSDRFETEVMRHYPGFMQIPSFANFRRQFRWYGFFWEYLGNGDFEFSHPYFLRDQKNLVHKVLTRRKAIRLRNPFLGKRKISERSAKLNFKQNFQSARANKPSKRILQHGDQRSPKKERCDIIQRRGTYKQQYNLESTGSKCVSQSFQHTCTDTDSRRNIESDVEKNAATVSRPPHFMINFSSHLAAGDAMAVQVLFDRSGESHQLSRCCQSCRLVAPAVKASGASTTTYCHDASGQWLESQQKLMYFLADAELYQLYTTAKADFQHAEFFEREQAQPVQVSSPSKTEADCSPNLDSQDSVICTM